MIDTQGLRRVAARLERELGLDPATAQRYANLVGDTPEVDSDGLLVIRDEDLKIIDRLVIPWLPKR